MLRTYKAKLYPILDPPQSDRLLFPRSLTRERTPTEDSIPNEYICTTLPNESPVRMLTPTYKTHQFPTTLKYVIQDGTVIWEQHSLAKGRFSRGEESMTHIYAFPAKDGGLHWFGHSEWSLLHPRKHQHGSRSHGDPDNLLVNTLTEYDVDFEKRDIENLRFSP
jgi:hypothetical protein